MPTTLERTTLTHTPPVRRMLQTASRHWPEDDGNSRALLLHLLEQGERTMRERELEAAYADAFAEWESSGEAAVWDAVTGDGLVDQP